MASPSPQVPPPQSGSVPTAQQRANFSYMALSSLVLVSWEIILHLPQDFKYLRTHGWWKRPILWAYFLQRYGAFIVNMAQVNIRLGCAASGSLSLILSTDVVLAQHPPISLIYLYRVLAIWNKRPSVKYTLIVLWVVCLGASLTAPFSQDAGNLPGGGCTVLRSEKWAPTSFIGNAVFDTFVLTVYKLGTSIMIAFSLRCGVSDIPAFYAAANRHQYKNFRSPIQTTLLRDGVLYFAVVVIIGIVDIFFLTTAKNPVVSSTVIPLHIALTSVMTTRLVNNIVHVVREGTMPEFLSQTRNGSVGSTFKGSGATPTATSTSTRTVIFIGSDVGTDYFNKATSENYNDDALKHSLSTHKGVFQPGQAFSTPLQLRVTTEVESKV
ncbi:hypothetical protein CC1G_07457 [Coprinopsis cinerea okayama7|uniref:Uncharacterized protein n=1 Tax=Coprinopsis cinerea (strain Okayama-7 / 130 / ATCC MYA-4618 / FGSC 9003) TaxID=240176 RepID=A8NB87_COPC7|nr:hypothetical protein CC1G_07457 [Coprinopsis cinerea okayama7\|eukprot:XP_001832086.2 hypothetical protein CC1G_07457 [Coprinopsis cinerea okayama7\